MDGMDSVRVEQDALGERGLPRVNVCRYANVSGGALLLMAVLCPLWQCCKCPVRVLHRVSLAFPFLAQVHDKGSNNISMLNSVRSTCIKKCP